LTLEGFGEMMKDLAPYIRLWQETRAAQLGLVASRAGM
jgi:hypothetical protein